MRLFFLKKMPFSKYILLLLLLFMGLFFQQGCSKSRHSKAVYLLIDMSVYGQKFETIELVLRHLLKLLRPGDSIALARIDGDSFKEKNIITRISFDFRPLKANAQKRAFLASVHQFGQSIKPEKNTDITGGILQSIEYLNEIQANKQYIFIFSDLPIDVKNKYFQHFSIDFTGVHVLSMNIKEAENNTTGPDAYLFYADAWRQRINNGNGSWLMLDDIKQLDDIIK